MGGDNNQVLLITRDGSEAWPHMAKEAVAKRLAEQIAAALSTKSATRK
jgi:phosphopantothenoylcysteine decarboxylase/phosphopantothenate--cysteine ligase